MLEFTTPVGRISVDCRSIVAVTEETKSKGFKCIIWVGDALEESAFNILEDYDTVMKKIRLNRQ
jgi:hypothetical protein